MKINKSRLTFLVVATVFLALSYLPLLASESTIDAFAREDGVFENLTALYLFIASLVFVACFFRFRESSWLLRLSYAGLALLFFVGAGEEISWGERIFNWNNPNYIKSNNVQGELTLHNLKYFQGEDAIIPISTSQLLLVFAFVFCVIIPLICRLSPKVERFLTPIFPVMPLDVGVLVVATYIFQKSMLRILPLLPALYQHTSMPIPQGVHEIREHGFTLALLVAATFYFWSKLDVIRAEQKNGSVGNLMGSKLSLPFHAQKAGDKK